MAFNIQSGRGGRRRAMSEINITPFVDVMLVLLIIFMVTAPMMEQKVPIDLPKTDKVDILTQSEVDNVLTIDKDSKIYFKGSEIPLDALESNELIKGMDEVYLYADRTLQYEAVVKVMGKLKRAGVKRLALVTDEEGKNELK